jgi:Replication-relaxation
MTPRIDARLVSSLTPRDRDILDSLARYRLFSSDLIRRLHFADSHHGKDAGARSVNRVMHRLEALHLVTRMDQRIGGYQGGSSSLSWQLSLGGHKLVAALTGQPPLSPLPASSWLFAQHTLAIAEVAIGLTEAERAGAFDVLRLDTEPQCWQDFVTTSGTAGRLKPDLYVVTADADFEEHTFIEVDLGTEHQPTLARKARTYRSYRDSGRHEATHGVFPRVLWVTPDHRRQAAVQAAVAPTTGEQDGLHLVVTFDDLPGPLAPTPTPLEQGSSP